MKCTRKGEQLARYCVGWFLITFVTTMVIGGLIISHFFLTILLGVLFMVAVAVVIGVLVGWLSGEINFCNKGYY